MKISFSQTYGNNRGELLQYRFRDKKMAEFLSHFDMNIFSFHNCSDEIVNWFIDKQKESNFFKNVCILRYNNITYPQCISKMLKFVRDHNISYFFFYQDDTFSNENDDISFEELIEYATNKKDIMLNLYYEMNCINKSPSYTGKTFSVANSTTSDFASCMYAFDDSAFLCSENYLDKIYDDEYKSRPHIWDAEQYINDKFNKTEIMRKTLDKPLFKNYNIIGPNSWNAKEDREKLQCKL